METTITRPVAATRRPALETPDRWRRALERAIAAGLEVFVVADTGERMVTSASKADQLHRSDGYRCTCEAALAGDGCCSHRAVVRFVSGRLALHEGTPAPGRRCPLCLGHGLLSDPDAPWRKERCARGCSIPGALPVAA